MDDIYGCGPKEKVEAFLAELHKEILMKSEIHEAGGEEFSHLKKKRTYKEDGSMLIQADSKHIREVGHGRSKRLPNTCCRRGVLN